ncbi:MAG: FAD-dependent oxidoreductase, partial [Bacteroidota bacterium]|nr:FAD-dependent oxidoreductase [Bacteroidota bacterium]
MQIKKFDVVIVGAGPAGCAAARMLSGNDLKIALLERDIF